MDNTNNMKKLTIPLLFIAYTLSGTCNAETIADHQTVWSPLKNAKNSESEIYSTQFKLAEPELQETLFKTNYRSITVPSPNGEMHTFELKDAQIMPQPLAVKFPNIKAFSGVSITNPALSGRFTLAPSGMSALCEASISQRL